MFLNFLPTWESQPANFLKNFLRFAHSGPQLSYKLFLIKKTKCKCAAVKVNYS